MGDVTPSTPLVEAGLDLRAREIDELVGGFGVDDFHYVGAARISASPAMVLSY